MKNKKFMTTKQRISNIIEQWYLKDPLFFMVWTTHELSVNPNLKNIRVGQGKIEYNPTFIDALDDKTLYQVLRFEAMRIMLKHPYLRRKEIQIVAYAASNITVQEYLKTPLDFPCAKQVFHTKEYDNKYFEFYYHQLLKQIEDKGSAMGQAAPSAGTGQQSGQTSDGDQTASQNGKDDSQKPEGKPQSPEALNEQSDKTTKMDQYTDPETSGIENTELWDANEYHSNQINDQIESALENNTWGTIPSRVQERILATLKPKVNYRDILKSFRTSILSVNRVLTRMKPSRRYGFLYMGSRRDFGTKLLFAVDVSGSVGSRDLMKAFSVINQLFKYGIEQVDVLQFDAEVKGEPLSLKKAKYKVKVIGRGGTNFQAVINYIDTHKDYDGLIIFTDGCAPVPTTPKNKRTRIIWLFNNERNYTRMKDDLRPLGHSAFIKES
ncbi:MAG: hypothetical protein DRR19_11065 [Candidatus Parabeggiatoa sp. nov. 1]|nr:MAG: hypothetical protein DRR19_11065 [Gammaproteobacteria bacterium]